VEFSLINRHAAVRIADILHIEELKVQLQQCADCASGNQSWYGLPATRSTAARNF